MKTILKRIFYYIIAAFIVFAIAVYGYIWVYDDSKPKYFHAEYNVEHLEKEVQRLEEVKEKHSVEVFFDSGKYKSILLVSARKETEPQYPNLEEQFDSRIYFSKTMKYHEYDNGKTEVAIDEWRYSSIKYKFSNFTGDGGTYNYYAELKGEEEAKDKPNYRYFLRMHFRKGDTRYTLSAFCNSPDEEFLNEIITEFVNQVNKFE